MGFVRCFTLLGCDVAIYSIVSGIFHREEWNSIIINCGGRRGIKGGYWSMKRGVLTPAFLSCDHPAVYPSSHSSFGGLKTLLLLLLLLPLAPIGYIHILPHSPCLLGL